MITINNRIINHLEEPYVIAELSANHNGSLSRAKKSIRIAHECGAHAVKIQTYNADTMTISSDRDDFKIQKGLWAGHTLYDLYHEAHTPFEWHEELFNYAKKIGITLFSTPFDETAVDLLESLNVPAYKIASFELTDLPLIRYAARFGKPMLMSTGLASEHEISEALEAARSGGCNSILLFHCISSYPAPIEQSNLNKIQSLKKQFNVVVGLSDHTLGNVASIAAVALGACAIEKHFTIDKRDQGPDSEFSIEPAQLKMLVNETKAIWHGLGNGSFISPQIESDNIIFRRSLYFLEDIKAGGTIKSTHIRRIRPGYGLAPKYFDQIIGKTVCKDVVRGQAVTWDVISNEID